MIVVGVYPRTVKEGPLRPSTEEGESELGLILVVLGLLAGLYVLQIVIARIMVT